MVGSLAVGAWVAYLTLVVLLIWGVASGSLGVKGVCTAVLACVVAYVATSSVAHTGTLFVSAVAIIDIVLVLAVFKRDVRF